MKKITLFATTFCFSFLLMTSCKNADSSKSTFDLTAAKKGIDSANKSFMDFLSKSDSVGLANCYTTDAKFMMPNAPAVSGKKNLESAFGGFIKGGLTNLTLTANNVWGDENMVEEEGAYTLAGKDGKQVDNGKYLVLWKMEDGKWKLFRDCFNSDLPVPPPPSK